MRISMIMRDRGGESFMLTQEHKHDNVKAI